MCVRRTHQARGDTVVRVFTCLLVHAQLYSVLEHDLFLRILHAVTKVGCGGSVTETFCLYASSLSDDRDCFLCACMGGSAENVSNANLSVKHDVHARHR